jgi:hypothetical protein
MRRFEIIPALAVLLLFSGFLPLLRGAFKNELPYEVRVTLLNAKREAYSEFSIPAHSVRYSKVINGTAVVHDPNGRLICTGDIISASKIDGYYDFKNKLFYYVVATDRLVPVRPAEARYWTMP